MITLFTGPMMSKKTTSLVKKYKSLPQEQTIFINHSLNSRGFLTHCKTNHNIAVCSVSGIEDLESILEFNCGGPKTICIDEIQFFEPDVYTIIEKYSNVFDFYIGGLNKDYTGKPFRTTANVAMIADNITVLSAVCSECSAEATYSYRVVNDSSLILVGGEDVYIPLCRKCYKEKMKVLV